MKKLILMLLLSTFALADTKQSEYPLVDAAATHTDDSFVFVDTSNAPTLATKRVKLWDIPNLPSIAGVLATIANPTFTGTVTIPSVNFQLNQLRNARMEQCSSDPAPGSSGRFCWNTTLNAPRIDNGSSYGSFVSRTVQGSWGSPILVSASSGITAANDRFQTVYVIGQGGAADLTGLNPQISAGFKDGDEMTIVSVSGSSTVKIGDGNGNVMNGSHILGAHGNCTLFWNLGSSTWDQKGWCNDL